MEQAQGTAEAQETQADTRDARRGDERRGDERRGGGDERRAESFEQMLRRFKKSVDNAGILKEVRSRSFFESKSQKERRKAAKAARRRSRNKSRGAE